MDIRRIVIGAIGFGAVLIVFLIYSLLSKTPEIQTKSMQAQHQQKDYRDLSERQAITLGPIGLFGTEDGFFQKRDKNQKVIAEWGFKQLSHEGRDILEVIDPYARLYLEDMNCTIKADNGQFRLDSRDREPYPKDAHFFGHVEILLDPTTLGQIEPTTVQLEDITFSSDRSLFSSAGPVDVRSERLILKGRGVSLTYNDHLDRIEHFQIEDLHRFSFQVPGTTLYQHIPTSETATTALPQTEAPDPTTHRALTTQLYHCRFYQGVTVKSPNQHLFTHEMITLSDIFWPGPYREPHTQSTETVSDAVSDPSRTEQLHPQDNDWITFELTCHKGLEMIPQGQKWRLDPNTLHDESTTQSVTLQAPEFDQESAGLIATSITYSQLRSDGSAQGPLTLHFLSDRIDLEQFDKHLIPVNVKAQKSAVYSAERNRILFEGDCSCMFSRYDPNGVEHNAALEAPFLEVVFKEAQTRTTIASITDLESLRAFGGAVRLSMRSMDITRRTSWLGQDSSSGNIRIGAEMLCTSCAYDPNQRQQVFTAYGPGSIRLNNSHTSSIDHYQDLNRMPFYALIDGFSTLQIFIPTHRPDEQRERITAEAAHKPMELTYLPMTGAGQTEKEIRVQAKHVDMTLVEINHRGERGIEHLTATGDVYFYQEYGHQFMGSIVSIDSKTHTMIIRGDHEYPCIANGFRVDEIVYNLKTGEFKTNIFGPEQEPAGKEPQEKEPQDGVERLF